MWQIVAVAQMRIHLQRFLYRDRPITGKKQKRYSIMEKILFMGSILVKLALEGPSVDPEFLGRCGNIIVAVV